MIPATLWNVQAWSVASANTQAAPAQSNDHHYLLFHKHRCHFHRTWRIHCASSCWASFCFPAAFLQVPRTFIYSGARNCTVSASGVFQCISRYFQNTAVTCFLLYVWIFSPLVLTHSDLLPLVDWAFVLTRNRTLHLKRKVATEWTLVFETLFSCHCSYEQEQIGGNSTE